MDTSSSLKFIPPRLLEEILQSFSRDRFLFGSDYPLGDPSEEIVLLEKTAGFSEREIEDLLSGGEKLLAEAGKI